MTIENRQSRTGNRKPGTPIAAPLTPRGRGAVATVRFQGDCRLIDAADPTIFRAANGKPLADQPINRIVFGHWGDATTEEVVLCRTAARTIEIHCHGGDAAVRRLLAGLESIGCTIQTWQQTASRRAGPFEAECTEALTRATTLRTAEILLEQQSGVLRSALVQLQSTEWTPSGRERITQQLDELLRWSDFGLHLSRPWKVVLAGRPNVGKSSLINALVGYCRSIVYDLPGTTRDVVTAHTALDGWPIQLADTAGFRLSIVNGPLSILEREGIRLARNRLAEADLGVLLFDTSRPSHADDHRLLSGWPDAVRVAHKCDLPNVWGDRLPDDALRVSSLSGDGVDRLARRLVAVLVPKVPEAGTPIPVTERQVTLLTKARDAATGGDEGAVRQALQTCLSI